MLRLGQGWRIRGRGSHSFIAEILKSFHQSFGVKLRPIPLQRFDQDTAHYVAFKGYVVRKQHFGCASSDGGLHRSHPRARHRRGPAADLDANGQGAAGPRGRLISGSSKGTHKPDWNLPDRAYRRARNVTSHLHTFRGVRPPNHLATVLKVMPPPS
jgi:hypothetical protein